MKNTKIAAVLILTIILFTALFVCVSASGDSISSFTVRTESAQDENALGAINWYKSADGSYYIFLPANADRSDLTVWFSATDDVMCGSTKLTSGKSTSAFAEGSSFTLTCGAASYQLKVLQATHTEAIYINTESGNMDAVHADKSHKESGNILIVDKNGEVQYDGVLDYIKGRGNSTWTLTKKPYNIKLDEKADLFGMGKHKSWCLLANASDASMIKNQLAYDLAYSIGITTTSRTFQTELYLNGDYAGLYLITEKVDIGENRVDIYDLEGETEDVNDKDLDEYKLAGKQNSREFGSIKYADIPNDPAEITGGYLLELEKIYRYVNEASGFITDIGQAVVVKTPEYASKAQVQYISNYYQDFEDALYSATGYNSKGKHYSAYIDVESLARMYIVLEFTSNFDGCSSSFYLYKDVDGKLTAGPAWDYDLSLGHVQSNDLINHVANVGDPSLLYIQTCFIGNHAENKNSLLAQAFSHNDFQRLVEKIWLESFETYYPAFRSNIDIFGSEALASVTMNAVKWNTFGTTDTSAIASHHSWHVSNIVNFAEARVQTLRNAYSPDTYFVKYNIGTYGKVLVKDTTAYKAGDTATVLPAPASTKSNAKFIGWSTMPNGIGKIYLPGDTITIEDDVKLFAVWDNNSKITNALTQLLDSIYSFILKITNTFSKIF